jgi:catechol 2,3-dioxygenase-like lactoylglutathione lyase family enzyme
MSIRSFLLAAALVFPTAPAAADDCRGAPKGEFLGEVKPVLYVADLARSVAFFRDTLGLEFLNYSGKEGDPFYAEMAAGPTKFGLHRPLNERQQARVGRQRLYFRVRDVKAQRDHVAACDGKPEPIVEVAWMTMFSVTDPDGHEITFAETDPKVHTIDPW